jgi:dTMP kinase
LTLKDKLTGKFIVFDGPDGCGKGTQIGLLYDKLTADGIDVVRAVDPGGTEIGDRIRSVLLDYDLSKMDVRCETFLFMASRAQLMAEVITPALEQGKAVLCDRFISATCAYQGAAGYDPKQIIELSKYAIGDQWPHLTFIINVPVEEGFKRTGRKKHHAGKNRKRHQGEQGMLFKDVHTDAMESRPLDFHRKVRDIFINLPELYPGKIEIIDGTGNPTDVHRQIMEKLTSVHL